MRRVVLATLLFAAACSRSPREVIESFESTLTVQADGAMQVQDRLVVHLGDTPVSEFRWRVPAWRHDGVSNVTASMDGAAFPSGDGLGRVDVGAGPDVDVRWRFAATSGPHVFGLSYRASKAIEVSSPRGRVLWRAIPEGPRPAVQSARITLTLPANTDLLDDPWVDEAGWSVTRERHGLTASRANVPAGEAGTVGIDFTVDGLSVVTPDWQMHAERAVQFVPAFISAAVFILIVATGSIWMLWLRYPRWRVVAGASAAPAVDLPTDTQHVLVRDRTGAARATRARHADLIALGLVDRERAIARRDLHRAGVAVMVFGVLSWGIVQWMLWQYGAWALVVPFSIVVAGVIFVVAATRFPVWSEAGARARVLYCARLSDGRTTE